MPVWNLWIYYICRIYRVFLLLFAFTNRCKMIPKFRWVYKMACAVLFVFIVMMNLFKDSSVDIKKLQSIEKKSINLWKENYEISDEAPQAPVYIQQGTRTWDITSSNCSANQNVSSAAEFSLLEPNFQQFLLYRHCRYFPMIMNHPEKCAEDVYLLIVIKSITTQFDRREVIRQTWGKEQVIDGKKIKTLFLLGKPSNEMEKENYQKLLEYEDYIYGDILQWDFVDTFFNLTLKETHFLKWFSIYCGNVQYIYKGDDDVFVSVENILMYLDSSRKIKDLFAGDVIMNAKPIRLKTNKYYIPESLYNNTYYPPYAGGGGFLMDGPLAKKLYSASETLDLYPIDDVFLGMCLEALHVTPIKHDAFKTFGLLKNKKSKLNKEPCFFKSMIVVHKLLPLELLDMWRLVNSDLNCTLKKIHYIQTAKTKAHKLY